LDGHIGHARLASILAAIAVGINPDTIAKRTEHRVEAKVKGRVLRHRSLGLNGRSPASHTGNQGE
jgi:hypothetical protein